MPRKWPWTREEPHPTAVDNRMFVIHAEHSGVFVVSRYFFAHALERRHNAPIDAAARRCVDVMPDPGGHPGVRFYKHRVAITWKPRTHDYVTELSAIDATMRSRLGAAFGINLRLQYAIDDGSDARKRVEGIAYIEREFGGLRMGPNDFQD